jgi:CPA1 family monovalent cation:H+ antiporter
MDAHGGSKGMQLFNIITILLVLSALFAYVNHRFIKLPMTIGLMLISMLVSLAFVSMGHLGLGLEAGRTGAFFLRSVNFDKTLMVGLLGFMLFAGALHLDVNDLLEHKWEIGVFALTGPVLSTFLVGSSMYFVLAWLGIDMRYIYCLLFGAIVSPTDPIAVLGIMKEARVPKALETTISGESLFNDGVAVVVFLILHGIATGEHAATPGDVSIMFVKETFGGFAFGLAIGWLAYRVLKSVDNYQVEILVTLALVTGGYALALSIHTSGPIAIVVSGLLVGNVGRKFAMSDRTRERIDVFWELIDEILNAILFVLIGLELLAVTVTGRFVLAGAAAIAVALLARLVSLAVPSAVLRPVELGPGALKILTWGGLRGGIAVALALSLPPGFERSVIMTMTYAVVAFSILVQGLTLKYLLKPAS